MAYDKNTDYQALINQAVAAGNYKLAAQYEQQRNEKITSEGSGYSTTNKYQGYLDDTDYGTIIKQQISSGASADEVQSILGKRVNKALNTEGLQKYAYDDIYASAMDYINSAAKSSKQNAEFSYASAPTYTSKYDDQIAQLTQALLNRDPFSYDYTTDPQYSAIKKQTMREADRTQADTLGGYAAMTGGIPSSAAITAASQAGDYAKSRATDIIPELYQAALAKFQAEDAMARNDIGLLMGQEQFAYGQYQDQLGQYNTDRAFDYGVFSDDRAQANYMDELGYNRRIYGDETAYSQALNKAQTMAALGDFSGYKALGYSDQEIATLNAAYQAAQTTTSRSSGGGSSGGSGGDEGGDLFEAMKASGNPYTFLSSNYKKYGVAYNSITAVYREYEAWLEGGDDGGGVGDSTLEEIWRNSQSQFSVSNRGVHSAEPGTELYRVFAQAARAAGFSQAEVEAFLARR